MKSLAWSEKQTAVLERDGHRCRLCNSDTKPEVHHRTYDNVGKESLSDLTTLCHICHKQYHDNPVPSKSTINEPNLLDDGDDIFIPRRRTTEDPPIEEDEADFTPTDEDIPF